MMGDQHTGKVEAAARNLDNSSAKLSRIIGHQFEHASGVALGAAAFAELSDLVATALQNRTAETERRWRRRLKIVKNVARRQQERVQELEGEKRLRVSPHVREPGFHCVITHSGAQVSAMEYGDDYGWRVRALVREGAGFVDALPQEWHETEAEAREAVARMVEALKAQESEEE